MSGAVMNIDEAEMKSLGEQYSREQKHYELLSEHVMAECQQYKRLNPRGLRVVFSRQPLVKEWESTIAKIRSKRLGGNSNYGISDVKDLIGLTILCAYESDKTDIHKWIGKAFFIESYEEKADESGHRARHYIVRVHADLYASKPYWQEKRCEIQVKTLLEEAFDAKAHDLTYKPGHLPVTPKIKKQFKHFSDVMLAFDMQSEFLKGLILDSEHQIALRRAACIGFYLDFPADLAYGALHGIDPKVEDPSSERMRNDLTTIQRLHRQEPNIRLCRLTAAYALRFRDQAFVQQALIMCNPLAKSVTNDSGAMLIDVAMIEWALSDFDSAMSHLLLGIEHASTLAATASLAAAKSTFVYLYADRTVSQKPAVRESWRARAQIYFDELKESSDDATQDSIGFYRIVFGSTRDEVEEGRRMVKKATTLPQPGCDRSSCITSTSR
jgi:ppGpp synthetase/RelA/SpoT-type nucleotidyltranferase